MALSRLELEIGWRYLRSRRQSRLLSLISVIAMGGVLLGVGALIVIMGVMNGMQTDLRDKILVGSPDLRVLPYGPEMRMPDWRAMTDKVRASKGVVAAAPFVSTQGMVRSLRGRYQGAQVAGIEAAGVNRTDVTTIRTKAIMGDFTFRRDSIGLPGAVLGKILASKLSAFVGDTILLLGEGSAELNASTGAIIPHADSAVVSGVFATDMFEYDDSYVYLDLATAQKFAGLGQDVTGIEVATRDRWEAPAVADSIRALLKDQPIRTLDWQEQNSALFQALKLEKLGMGVILGLIVVVAAFNIVSTLTMVVTDKTREIGILRAMGFPARSIRRVFFVQGMIIGAVGTAIGVVLGLGVSVLLERYHLIKLDPSVYFIDHLPVLTEPLDVLSIIVASLAIAAVATYYPASQAARMYPVEAIRHE